MYKPPLNNNRVKSIKNKFENIENSSKIRISPSTTAISPSSTKAGILTKHCATKSLKNVPQQRPIFQELSSSNHQQSSNLSRQLSDPLKRQNNIKRTPAFRVDKNVNNSSPTTPTTCSTYENISPLNRRHALFENKVKQFNNAKQHVGGGGVIKDDFFCSDDSQKSGGFFLNSFKNSNNSNSTCKPYLIKSKSSIDFQYVRSKFNKETVNASKKTSDKKEVNNYCDKKENSTENPLDLSLLYTEPIPKALRPKNINQPLIQSHCAAVSRAEGGEEEEEEDDLLEDIYTKSTLRLTDIEKKDFLDSLKLLQEIQPDLATSDSCGLTDTLKLALSKPLPNGPAPKKPPRTFQHDDVNSPTNNNSSFLHPDVDSDSIRKSAKYKLNKLVEALENKHIKLGTNGRHGTTEISGTTTSGEDSDDSLLFRSKSCSNRNRNLLKQSFSPSPTPSMPPPPPLLPLPQLPSLVTCNNNDDDDDDDDDDDNDDYFPKKENNYCDSLLSEFNCFNAFGCTANQTGTSNNSVSAYNRLKEPCSSFFVNLNDSHDNGPIYAEPQRLTTSTNSFEIKPLENQHRKSKNTLYYMSTAVIGVSPPQSAISSPVDTEVKNLVTHDLEEDTIKQHFTENSSLSSFASDFESNQPQTTTTTTTSVHADDPHAKINLLIQTFERRQKKMLKNSQKSLSSVEGAICSTPISNNNNYNKYLESTAARRNCSGAAKMSMMSSDESINKSEENDRQNKVARIVAKFQAYQKITPKYQKPVNVHKDNLFLCCLIIEKVHEYVRIKYKYPPDVEIPPQIEHLCFPENSNSIPLDGNNASHTAYTLLITDSNGKRTYGYCRRVLPEGSTQCLPLAYCILSKYSAPRFYKKILMELESRHGLQTTYRNNLIREFYHKEFPQPGNSITINLASMHRSLQNGECTGRDDSFDDLFNFNGYGCVNVNNTNKAVNNGFNNDTNRNTGGMNCTTEETKEELVLTLHQDTRYEMADLKKLHKLPANIVLKIFSSLLLERKIILISAVISKLSACVDCIQSILFPFTWYHTLIPVVPEPLWDIVESPTPVVCGVLSVDAIADRKIENGIIVNLDTQTVLVEEGDEMKILSDSQKKIWRQFVSLADTDKSKSTDYVNSVFLGRAYLWVFISFLKNYKKFIVDGKFLKEEFIQSIKSNTIRRFLRMFTDTCMFQAFIDSAINHPQSVAAFDKCIDLYGSEDSFKILNKLTEWHKLHFSS